MNVLSGVRDLCRQYLHDNVGDALSGERFGDNEIDLQISDCLIELSLASPYETTEDLTADGTYELDLSDVDDLIEVIQVEYPVDDTPRTFFNCSQFGDTLTIDRDGYPSSGETVRAYCRKYHTLDESTTTLNKRQEQLLIMGTCGKLAMNKAMQYINRVNLGGTNAYSAIYQWGAQQYALFQRGLKGQRKFKVYKVHQR
jgi:hypothetical protein